MRKQTTITLSPEESLAWGAYEADGRETDDGGEYRREMIRRLAKDAGGLDVHVYASGAPVDAEDWLLTVIDGCE